MKDEAITTTQTAERVHDIVDGVADRAAELEKKARAGIDVADKKAQEARSEIEREARQAAGSIENFIKKQPVTTAALAFAAGVVATVLLRR
jgi:ElaB/YqjD/DUF883 family membrane-anchored ribosome-binding protein